ncbi:MAG: AMP-binding protein [Gemmataceae bacterium]|nr:AMP-binding protein [Gemmataceae bacterium]MDW8265603.1 AMP-binding protein [Gemmataceae bacterium]
MTERSHPAPFWLQALRWALWGSTRFLLARRYRLTVQGLETLGPITGPTLIVPNHPAYIDPALVLVTLWPRFRPRPLVYEGMFRFGLLRPLFRLADALAVPDLERASLEARERASQTLAGVVGGLRAGQSYILWPAGRIQRGGGLERLGGTRALADILQAMPELTLIRVRTRGLWGSRFSYAYTGQQPRIIRCLLVSAGWLLANLLFFMPKRSVRMVVERVDPAQLPERKRETLNPWLEAWYNADGPEPATYVPYHCCLAPKTYEFPTIGQRLADADLRQVKPATKAAVSQLLTEFLKRPLTDADLRPEMTLDQLGLDSLDRMELTLRIEREFGFHADQTPANVGELWALAQGLVERAPPKPPARQWFRPLSDDGPLEILGDTLAEAFVRRALKHPRDTTEADDLSGVLTYERLLAGAWVLSRRLARLPGTNIGLMLPSSVAGDVCFFALHLAGKLPVMLNWTSGPANLVHAVRRTQLRHVITSRAFIDRTGVEIPGVEYVYVEKLREGISRWELLRTLLRVRYAPSYFEGRLPRPDPDQPAVILFTSGSERAPKTVPLTHRNLISDQRSGIPFFGLTRRDSLIGFLPAFHSFGLTATMLMPILGGMRVVRHPDPTDAAGLARKIAAYRPSLLVGTPTFVGHILDRARSGELDSLRLIVVGAEKCPPALYERCRQMAPGATLLEGYGVTECSPVVAVNRPHCHRPGTLGQPLPGVDVRVVDLETDEPLPTGRMGMLWVSGPIVFPGYLDDDGPSPFRERDGKRWYVTGDLATIDADGFIHFCGRLKRFLKAGGEMISLPALEEPFVRRFPPTPEGPRVAVEGIETEHGRRIVLFTTEPIDLSQANAWLREEGLHGIMRIDEVRRVQAIPVLGTGKTDYKVLRAMITSEATTSTGSSAPPEAAASGSAT